MASKTPSCLDIEDTLAKLTLHDKIKLLTGKGFWKTAQIPDPSDATGEKAPLVPSIVFSDGPNGVRGKFFNGFLSSCFPCSSGIGSSFDKDLAAKVGEALGKEAGIRGVHVLLGPTINTQRSPLGGRSFESYSEDPHLNGMIAAEYIKALQATGVSACVKHFVANDQEFERFSMSSEVSERALREIYLKPFQIAIRDGNPWSLMTSYNPVNGVHSSENKWLLDDILRKEWGWNGLVTSDWTGTYSTVRAIKAGLDLEMPGPTVKRGQAIGRVLAAHKLDVGDIDTRVRNILAAVQRAQKSGIPFDPKDRERVHLLLISCRQLYDSAATFRPDIFGPPLCASSDLLREACADSIILLKNQPTKADIQKKLLPLGTTMKKIAVIGPNAVNTVISGGGSSTLRPTYVVSPLDGITNAAKCINAEVRHTVGVNDTARQLLTIDPYLKNHGGSPQLKKDATKKLLEILSSTFRITKNVVKRLDPKSESAGGVNATSFPLQIIEHAAEEVAARMEHSVGANATSSPLTAVEEVAKKIVAHMEHWDDAADINDLTERPVTIEKMIGRMSLPGLTKNVALFESWDAAPTDDWMDTDPDFAKKMPPATHHTDSYTASCFFLDEDEDGFPEHNWSKFSATFYPDEDGEWSIDLFFVFATGNFFIDQELVIDLSTDPQLGKEFFGMGTRNVKTSFNFKKGRKYNLELRMCNKEFVSKIPSISSRGGLKLGISKKPKDVDVEIKEAVRLAKWADVAILVVGMNEDWESEGFDRTTLELPGSTNKLVEAVIATNPNTVVVIQSGAPVEMPWVDKLEHGALLQAFYGGNETGNGIADVLFGETNPSAKLPLTFPKRVQDNPSYPSYGFRTQDKDKVLYNEGIFVGYRGYEIKDVKPLFPFGFGLSYTTFEYSNLDVSKISPDGSFTVKFTIKNTGTVFGREVAQVYVSDTVSSLPRPKKELHGFTKVPLNAGQSKTVSVSLDKYALSFFDEKAGHWIAEAGEFGITVGGSSDDRDLLSTQFITLGQGFTWSGL